MLQIVIQCGSYPPVARVVDVAREPAERPRPRRAADLARQARSKRPRAMATGWARGKKEG